MLAPTDEVPLRSSSHPLLFSRVCLRKNAYVDGGFMHGHTVTMEAPLDRFYRAALVSSSSDLPRNAAREKEVG